MLCPNVPDTTEFGLPSTVWRVWKTFKSVVSSVYILARIFKRIFYRLVTANKIINYSCLVNPPRPEFYYAVSTELLLCGE